MHLSQLNQHQLAHHTCRKIYRLIKIHCPKHVTVGNINSLLVHKKETTSDIKINEQKFRWPCRSRFAGLFTIASFLAFGWRLILFFIRDSRSSIWSWLICHRSISILVADSSIESLCAQQRDMLASNSPTCPDLRTPVTFWVWKEPIHLLNLSLAEGSNCSREICLSWKHKMRSKYTILFTYKHIRDTVIWTNSILLAVEI